MGGTCGGDSGGKGGCKPTGSSSSSSLGLNSGSHSEPLLTWGKVNNHSVSSSAIWVLRFVIIQLKLITSLE